MNALEESFMASWMCFVNYITNEFYIHTTTPPIGLSLMHLSTWIKVQLSLYSLFILVITVAPPYDAFI